MRPVVGAALLWFAPAGCASLPLIQADMCGNRVVEVDAGEDCDGQARCGAAGSAHACRYACSLKDGIACPDGFGCGVDDVCRRPTGTFERLLGMSAEGTRDILVGDINDDGCAEMVRTTLRETELTAFESRVADACEPSEQVLQTSRPDPEQESAPIPPILVDLTTDARPDLVVPGRGHLGEGVFVHVAEPTPTLSPVFFPSAARAMERMLTLAARRYRADVLLMFGQEALPPSTQETGVVAAVIDPRSVPPNLHEDLPGGTDDIAALRAADLDGRIDPEGTCDEVILARAGATHIELFNLCQLGPSPGVIPSFAPLPNAVVSLDSGAKLRSSNVAVAVVDYNGDGPLDVLTNADDGAIHIAYGLGDGRFHSTSPVPVPPAVPDQTTSILPLPDNPMLQQKLQGEDNLFVAGDFDGKPGVEIEAIACPPNAPFVSPVCADLPSPCQAVVADIDADGILDVVAADGQPDLRLQRGLPGGGFHTTFIETQCPPRQITAGDIDGDGVVDIAFLDQEGTEEAGPVTTVKVAYGNAYAVPEEPRLQGRLQSGEGLSAGSFLESTPGGQLYATRPIEADEGPSATALSLLEGQSERLLVAPFYFPAPPPEGTPDPSGEPPDSVIEISVHGAAAGQFGGGDGAPQPSFAVVGLELDGDDPSKDLLWLIDGDVRTGTIRPLGPSADAVPACDFCVLAALPAGADQRDTLLVLGDGEMAMYTPDATGFHGISAGITPLQHSFQSVIQASNPAKYTPRPQVADLDGDGQNDVVVQATDGALVALWGDPGGGFVERELVPPPGCVASAPCVGFAMARLNIDADADLEVAVVGPDHLGLYDLVGRDLVPISVTLPIPAPSPMTDYTAIAAGDMDGDGVTDLVIANSSTFIDVLRGVPER